MYSFYLVADDDETVVPFVTYTDYDEAAKKAKELVLETGRMHFVLKAIDCFDTPQPAVVRHKLENAPKAARAMDDA